MDHISSANLDKIQKRYSSTKKKKNTCKICGNPIPSASCLTRNIRETVCQMCLLKNNSENQIDTQDIQKEKLLFSCKYKYNGCKERFHIKSLDKMLSHLKNCSHTKQKTDAKLPLKPAESVKYSFHDCVTNFNLNITDRFKEKSKSMQGNEDENLNVKIVLKQLDEKYASLFGYLNQKMNDLENKNTKLTTDLKNTSEELEKTKKETKKIADQQNFEASLFEKRVSESEEKLCNISKGFNEIDNKVKILDSYMKLYKDEEYTKIENQILSLDALFTAQKDDVVKKFKEIQRKIKQLKLTYNYSNLEIHSKFTNKLFNNNTIQTRRYQDTVLSYKPFLDTCKNNNSKKNILITPVSRTAKPFKSDPSNLKFHSKFTYYEGINLPNIFAIFDIEKEWIIAFPSKDFNIELIKVKTKQTLKNLIGHESFIFCIRHKKVDLVDYLVSSSYDQSIKIWKLSDFTLHISINNCHLSTSLYSCLFVQSFNGTNIISSVFDNELMKVYDMNGNLQREIGNIKDRTLFIDIWEKSSNDLFIINGNNNDVKMYDFISGKMYKSFLQKGETSSHCCAIIHEEDKHPCLMECDDKGMLRLWDITTSNLVKSLQVGKYLSGIINWGNNFILAADVGNIKVINIKEWKVVKSLSGGNKNDFHLGTIAKFYHPEHGESLMCGLDCYDNQICLWTVKTLSITI